MQIDGGYAFNGSGTYVDNEAIFENAGVEVEAFGIARIYKDSAATGSMYISSSSTTTISTVDTPVKIAGTTTTAEEFRVDDDGGTDNRLRYTGEHTRHFTVICTMGVDSAGNNKTYTIYVAKNGTVLPESGVPRKIAGGGDVGSIAVSVTTEMETDDYIEMWVENNSDTTDFIATGFNCSIS